jgi:CspA family cold shock protein
MIAHSVFFRHQLGNFLGAGALFNGQKGYGFIAPDGGGKDVFVHISAVEKAGLDGLPDGAKVTYDVVPNKGKESAENLRVQ